MFLITLLTTIIITIIIIVIVIIIILRSGFSMMSGWRSTTRTCCSTTRTTDSLHRATWGDSCQSQYTRKIMMVMTTILVFAPVRSFDDNDDLNDKMMMMIAIAMMIIEDYASLGTRSITNYDRQSLFYDNNVTSQIPFYDDNNVANPDSYPFMTIMSPSQVPLQAKREQTERSEMPRMETEGNLGNILQFWEILNAM